MSFARLQTRTRSSSAFTLVELMIVIAIVGILASLVTVGVMKALEKAKDVSARLEISQLEAAIAAAKQKLNLNGLPTYLILFEDLQYFNTVANSPANADYIGASTAYALLSKIYESSDYKNWDKIQISSPYKKDWNGNSNINEPNNGRIELFGIDALLFMLGGEIEAVVTNGNKTVPKFKGFNPLTPKKPKGPFYEPTGNVWANTSNYYSIYDANQTAYAYFDSNDYKRCYIKVGSDPLPDLCKNVKPFVLKASTMSFVNPRSFQIISAGKDQTFGKNFSGTTAPYTSIEYMAGTTPWSLTGSDTTGYDDISNFASSFLGKKDE